MAFHNRMCNPPHDLSITVKAYRDVIPEGHRHFIVPEHASPIYIHLTTKCLRLAVPRQELDEIDMINNILRADSKPYPTAV